MFRELGPLLRQRTVVMILTRLEDDTIRVNVIPRKLNESENDALTTPLSVAGTAEELDAELPSTLVQFVGAHLELKNTLESAKEQMAAAAKAAKAEARSKAAAKTAPVRTEPAGTETKKPGDAAPKPAEPRKQEPARNASLFDIGPALRLLPCPPQMRMRKKRFSPKPKMMSQRMNLATWTKPPKRQSRFTSLKGGTSYGVLLDRKLVQRPIEKSILLFDLFVCGQFNDICQSGRQ